MMNLRSSMPQINLTAMVQNVPAGLLCTPRAELERAVPEMLGALKTEFKRIGDAQASKIDDLEARARHVEQLLASLGRGGGDGLGGEDRTPGAKFTASPAFKAFGGANGRGTVRAVVNMITSTSAGALITPDKRSEIVGMPRRRLTIRGLLAPGNTASNTVQFARQTTRTNNASIVTEGEDKPESALAWELDDAPVRTIAHWVPVSRQAMDDAPLLQSTIDGELRYGLQVAEEGELLLGSGTGQHIHGIVPQATAYNTGYDATGDTRFDTIAHALAQAEVALLPSTGIVLNNNDLEELKVIKDEEGRYIGGGPFGPPITSIWGRPVVGTPAMPADHFLVGAFLDGAQIFDRLDAEVMVSSEDRDNFIKNMLTVRAEERLAMAVKRPDAFIYGSFP